MGTKTTSYPSDITDDQWTLVESLLPPAPGGGRSRKTSLRKVFARKDSPQTLLFQLNLLQQVGFGQGEVLHKNGCFAAFGGIRN